MIDWTARIDYLAFHLATQYRLEDREALEILRSALISCPRTQNRWLTIETNWFSRIAGTDGPPSAKPGCPSPSRCSAPCAPATPIN